MLSKTTHIINNFGLSYEVQKLKKEGLWILTSELIQNIMPHSDCVFVTNSENSLIKALNRATNYRILTNGRLFKKYIFFEKLESFPQFPFFPPTINKISECSEQNLALLFALWTESEVVYLFGFDIENLNERTILLSIIEAHPHQRIFYVRKPNKTKIRLFDRFSNVRVIDYKEYENAK